MKKVYHVSKTPEGDWQYKLEKSKRASGVVDTQKEAEKTAKNILKNNSDGGEVVIHSRDGLIRDKDTVKPANDPFPPRDKKH